MRAREQAKREEWQNLLAKAVSADKSRREAEAEARINAEAEKAKDEIRKRVERENCVTTNTSHREALLKFCQSLHKD